MEFHILFKVIKDVVIDCLHFPVDTGTPQDLEGSILGKIFASNSFNGKGEDMALDFMEYAGPVGILCEAGIEVVVCKLT